MKHARPRILAAGTPLFTDPSGTKEMPGPVLGQSSAKARALRPQQRGSISHWVAQRGPSLAEVLAACAQRQLWTVPWANWLALLRGEALESMLAGRVIVILSLAPRL